MKISCAKFQDYVEMCEKIRYFEICGKQCRALRFEKEITNKSKDSYVFVRNIPKDLKQVELHQIFEQYGPIVSLKLSFNADHTSKGIGYITFQNEDSAQAAISRGAHGQNGQILAIPYQAEKEPSPQNNGNNLYVKFIPESWTEETLREKFGKFGVIKSLKL